MSLLGRGAKKQSIAIGSRVQRRDRLPFTKRGVVLEIVEPSGSFDVVRHAKVRWDDAAQFVELWPVDFLIIAPEEEAEIR